MRRTMRSQWVAVLLGLICSRELPAEEPFTKPDQVTNAALVYWQAFSMLPQLTEAQSKLLTDVESKEAPLADAGALVGQADTAMSMTQVVSPQTACRWDLIEAGPATLLPHLGKARLLARLLALQARLDAAAGKTDAAITRLAAALLVARNIDDGTLVQLLVGNAIENQVLNAAEQIVPKLDAAGRKQLATALGQLPPRATFAKAIGYERDVFGRWIEPLVTGDAKQARAELAQLGAGADSAEAKAILAGTMQERQARYKEFIAAYDVVIAAAQSPAPQAAQELERAESQFEKSSNPLIQLLMPAGGRAYTAHAATSARIAKLEEQLSD